ncbi:MAG TPA: T9SS type A sorting domain-containing protein [Ferruginibacter sp.]|nr:T9SS type A sorting domain-containing protein [Ferruginibacter sp.]
MNKKFTFLLLLCAFISGTITTKAETLPWLFQFQSNPVRISGTNNAVNSVYRIANVKAGTDAIITIVSATGGATVNLLDDNAISKPEAFSPNIKIKKNSTGYVDFRIDFVITGTLIPFSQDSLYATGIDIDGNNNVHEIDGIDIGGGVSSYWVSSPEISVVQNGTMYVATNVAGHEYDGIDTSAKQVMFTVKHNNVASFTFRCGASNYSNSSQNRQTSLYFRDFIYPQGGPLAVTYISFDAVANNNAVTLKWVTAQEINNSHFEVERSFDNNNFSTIAIVLDGFTTSGTGKSYMAKDNASELKSKSIVYYRLKQVDIDGKVTYSKVLAVRLQAKADVAMQVSPNPFAQNLNIRFTATENGIAQIRIINTNGQTLLSKQSTISKGFNNIQLDGLTGLSSGVYVAQLVFNGILLDKQQVVKLN